jgi:hypothetical protein
MRVLNGWITGLDEHFILIHPGADPSTSQATED